MNVPQQLSLSNQTYNSEFVEFVWQFPYSDDEQDQVILKVHKEGTAYLEGGRIDTFGDYTNEGCAPDYFVEDVEPEYFLNDSTDPSLNYVKRYLTFVEILHLAEDSIKFLNE